MYTGANSLTSIPVYMSVKHMCVHYDQYCTIVRICTNVDTLPFVLRTATMIMYQYDHGIMCASFSY